MRYGKHFSKLLLVISILVISAVLFEVVFKIVIGRNQYVETAENFLRSSSKVKEKYGEIYTVGVTKLTSVSATPSSRPYKIIAFYISGEESGVEEVVVYPSGDNSGDDSISIHFR